MGPRSGCLEVGSSQPLVSLRVTIPKRAINWCYSSILGVQIDHIGFWGGSCGATYLIQHHSPPKYPFPMRPQKPIIRQKLLRHLNPLSLINQDIPRQRLIREVFPAIRGKHQPVVLVERHQYYIKSGILGLSQTQAVPGIEAILGKFAPRQNMTGNQQFRNE